ncbi:Protein SRG1 [Bienertia sinuspersici]
MYQKNFITKTVFPEAIDASELWNNDLLIDFSLLSASSSSQLAKLQSALSQWGCFQVINHGIESSFFEELIEISKQFFALPLEEKLKCSAEDDIIEGYGSDAIYSGNQTRNWNDRLFLTLYPKEKFKDQCWPQKPEKFREKLVEYLKKLTQVNEAICKAMSRSLNLDENCLHFGKQGPSRARITLYPRCSFPDRVLGTKPHADGTGITYLLPEKDVEGLQILKDDQWYKVAVIPGALIINLGDLGEVYALIYVACVGND